MFDAQFISYVKKCYLITMFKRETILMVGHITEKEMVYFTDTIKSSCQCCHQN